MLAQPLNALCLLAVGGFFIRLKWKVLGQKLMNAALLAIVLLGILPVGPGLMVWLERQFPTPTALPAKIDGIILLGGAFESYLTEKTGHIVSNDQVDRALCFAELAKKYPEATLVFSGGQGDIMNPDAMESRDAEMFFNLAGLGGRKTLYEIQSRNTYENGLFTKELLKPLPGQNWVLATSAYHMPRSVGVFEKIDFPVIPYQCDPRTDGTYDMSYRFPSVAGNYGSLNIALKEIIGLVTYYFTGKSAFIVPPAGVRLRYESQP